MEYPASDEAKAIGKDAEKIFESFLDSRKWNDSRIHREDDFGLDYRIEAIYSHRVVGYEFYVQLKGTTRNSIISNDEVIFPVQIKTSTIRYWKNKFPPILIVVVDCNNNKVHYQWFDRNLEITQEQDTVTIRVPATRLLEDQSLRMYLDQYYGSFRIVLDNNINSNFVRRFIKDISAVSSILHVTVTKLLFKPNLRTEEEASEYFDNLLNTFLFVFGRFGYDLDIYGRGVSFDGHPIMQALGQHVERINEINKKVICNFGATPGYQMSLTNHDALLKYMPTLVYTTTQIMDFFVGIVYGNGNENSESSDDAKGI